MVLVFWFCRAICCLCLLMSNHSVQCRLNNPSTRWNFPSLSSSHKLLTWLEFQVSPNIFLIKFRTHPPQIPSVSSVARTKEILHKETIFFGSGERCNKIKLNLQFWGFSIAHKKCLHLCLAFLGFSSGVRGLHFPLHLPLTHLNGSHAKTRAWLKMKQLVRVFGSFLFSVLWGASDKAIVLCVKARIMADFPQIKLNCYGG